MPEIDFFFVVVADEVKGILEYGHHSEAKKIDLDDAHIGTVFFIPLHNNAARHGGWFQSNDGIQLSLAQDPSSRMLPEMPRQILPLLAKLTKLSKPTLLQADPHTANLPASCVSPPPTHPHPTC